MFVAAGLVTGCPQKTEIPTPAISVEVAPARMAPITEHIVADAILAPIAQASISPRISAAVTKFYVHEGSRVRAGELLATLESRDLQAAVTQTRGDFEAAEAMYAKQIQVQIPEEFHRAELDTGQAEANLKLMQSIVASREKLFEEGAIAGRDLDSSKTALVQAQGVYELAENHLASMKQVRREALLEAAEGQMESARAKYQGAQGDLRYSELRSPIAGVVTARFLYAGETAPSQKSIITVMDTTSLLAKIHLAQVQAQLLHEGNTAFVQVAGQQEPVQGKIVLINPALDPGSTTVEVWVLIDNSKGQLRPGSPARVTLDGRRVAKALVVPSESVVVKSGRPIVMVVGTDGLAHRMRVETGISDARVTQVLKGVSAGQMVVTGGAASLGDGIRVNSLDGSKEDNSKLDARSGEYAAAD